MSDRRDTALRLCAAGLPIIPLYGPNEGIELHRGKKPRPNGWQTKALTLDELARWWAQYPDSNLGLVTGALSGIVGIDVDLRNGGDAWRQENKERIRALGPDLGIEKTGNGWRLWFRHPGGWIKSLTGKNGIAPGVELLADDGHQMVVSPSIHKTGFVYRWLSGLPPEDQRDYGVALPEWIAVPGVAPVRKTRQRDETTAYTDSPAAIALCRERLMQREGAVEGAGGDDATVAAARVGRDHGLSPATFLPLLMEWNATCLPPWDAGELETKMHNAYRYAKAATPGQALPENDFVPVAGAAGGGAGAGPVEVPLDAAAAAAQQAEIAADDWQGQLATAGRGEWKSHTRNVELVLAHDPRLAGVFRYNLMAQQVELMNAPWRQWDGPAVWVEDDTVALSNWITQSYPSRPTMGPLVVLSAIRPYVRRFSYHPVRDYLDGLKWDGKPRISTWLTRHMGAADDVYTKAVARRFLIAAVARVRKPGCKVDTMLVLEGKQGQMKSTAIRVLFGEDWFTDAELDIGNKDAAMNIRGRWCVEMQELTAAGKAEVNLLKAFISRQVDRQRDAFARVSEDHPRHCVFVGTTNSAKYLRDSTGGRRFWPVQTAGRFYIPAIARERDQLWAEAAAAHAAGEQHWMTDEEEAAAQGEQEARYMADEWEGQVASWLARGGDFEPLNGADKSHKSMDRVTGMEVWIGCLGGSPATLRRETQHRISEIMERLGWTRGVYRVDGRNVKGYMARGSHIATVAKPDNGSS